jgi:hypothetical protein
MQNVKLTTADGLPPGMSNNTNVETPEMVKQ